MAKKRERKLPPEFIKQFIETYDIKNTDDIKAADVLLESLSWYKT